MAEPARPAGTDGRAPGLPWRLSRLSRLSMRGRLLLGIVLPVVAVVALNAASLYRQALRAADTAYDRTLLASAKSIGEQLEVEGGPAAPRLRAAVPYSALEAFEADNRSRLFYRVTGFQGEMVSGFDDLPRWRGQVPLRPPYAALVDFYDDHYRGEAVRMAVLLQPVSGRQGLGMATIQVAETLELRRTLARQLLVDLLWREALMLALVVAVVWWVVDRATAPVRALSDAIARRRDDDLSPITSPDTPRELAPLVEASNVAFGRVARLVAHQQRFVREAAHQLRTPLAVLKVQVQSARRGDLPPEQALAEIAHTTERATELANQMLALAKVEQLRQQGEAACNDWAEAVRTVALDLGALVAERDLAFDLQLPPQPVPVPGHDWALRELSRNLLHNAVRASPPGGALTLRLHAGTDSAELQVDDDGPGIPEGLRQRLGQPFASGSPGGIGLGLAIVREIVDSLGGQWSLADRVVADRVCGARATVRLPRGAAQPGAPAPPAAAAGAATP